MIQKATAVEKCSKLSKINIVNVTLIKASIFFIILVKTQNAKLIRYVLDVIETVLQLQFHYTNCQ